MVKKKVEKKIEKKVEKPVEKPIEKPKKAIGLVDSGKTNAIGEKLYYD